MPDRVLRAGILTSDAVNQLTWAGEVFYRRLISVVDDYGLYDGRPAILRSALYALKLDNVSEPDVSSWLAECQRAGLVRGYVVSGKPYLQLLKFGQRVRAKMSKWPLPPDDCSPPTRDSNARADAGLDGVGVGVGVDDYIPPNPPQAGGRLGHALDTLTADKAYDLRTWGATQEEVDWVFRECERRELGEKPAGYLKQMIETQRKKQIKGPPNGGLKDANGSADLPQAEKQPNYAQFKRRMEAAERGEHPP